MNNTFHYDEKNQMEYFSDKIQRAYPGDEDTQRNMMVGIITSMRDAKTRLQRLQQKQQQKQQQAATSGSNRQ